MGVQPTANMQGAQKRASGGWIHGAGTATSDSVPLMASAGEFVVNARAAGPNAALLEAINAGQSVTPTGQIGIAMGTERPQVSPPQSQPPEVPRMIMPPSAEGGTSTTTSAPVNLQINLNFKGDIVVQGGEGGTSGSEQMIQDFMDRIKPALRDEVMDMLVERL